MHQPSADLPDPDPVLAARAVSVVVDVADEVLLELVLDVCGAAGVVPLVRPVGDGPVPPTDRAGLVILDESPPGQRAWPQNGCRVVVVARGEPTADQWRTAVSSRASDVLVLPEQVDRLLDEVSDAMVASTGLVVGLMGARGGVGVSTLAAAIGVAAGESGTAIVIDLDPCAGGLEHVLGEPDSGGARWDDLWAIDGRVEPHSLVSSLPRVAGLPFLSFSPGRLGPHPPAETVAAVVRAARRACGVVVLDLPRHAALAEAAASECDVVGVLTRIDTASLHSAGLLVDRLEAQGHAVGVLARCRRRVPPDVAHALGEAVAGLVPDDPGVVDDCACGIPPGGRSRSRLGRAARSILAGLPTIASSRAVPAARDNAARGLRASTTPTPTATPQAAA